MKKWVSHKVIFCFMCSSSAANQLTSLKIELQNALSPVDICLEACSTNHDAGDRAFTSVNLKEETLVKAHVVVAQSLLAAVFCLARCDHLLCLQETDIHANIMQKLDWHVSSKLMVFCQIKCKNSGCHPDTEKYTSFKCLPFDYCRYFREGEHRPCDSQIVYVGCRRQKMCILICV